MNPVDETNRLLRVKEAFQLSIDLHQGKYDAMKFFNWEATQSRAEDPIEPLVAPPDDDEDDSGYIRKQCEACRGSGCDPGSIVPFAEKCGECDGAGWLRVPVRMVRKRAASATAQRKEGAA